VPIVPTLVSEERVVTEPVAKPFVVLTLLPMAVRTPVPVVVVDGATPAPPPMTIAFAAKAAEDAHVVPLLK
jgi:hypothetical protein